MYTGNIQKIYGLAMILIETYLAYKLCHTNCKGCNICNTEKINQEKLNLQHHSNTNLSWPIYWMQWF